MSRRKLAALAVFAAASAGCSVSLVLTVSELVSVVAGALHGQTRIAFFGMLPWTMSALLLPVMSVGLLISLMAPPDRQEPIATRAFAIGLGLAAAASIGAWSVVGAALASGGYGECVTEAKRGTFSTLRTYATDSRACQPD